MSDLVKQGRFVANFLSRDEMSSVMHALTVGQLCDRIEELELELATRNSVVSRYMSKIGEVRAELAAEKEAHKTCEFMLQTNASVAANLAVKLAAEKALADRLAVQLFSYTTTEYWSDGDEDAIAAYYKARGM